MVGTLLIQEMEQAGEMGEIGGGAHHEAVLQSGRDTGEHEGRTVDSVKDEKFRVRVHNRICPRLQA